MWTRTIGFVLGFTAAALIGLLLPAWPATKKPANQTTADAELQDLIAETDQMIAESRSELAESRSELIAKSSQPAVEATNRASAAPLPPKPGAAPIVIVKGREHTITIHSGPRFTVATNDGKVLANQLSTAEIRQKLPEIYKTYESSFAGGAGHLDASGSARFGTRPLEASRRLSLPPPFLDASAAEAAAK